MISTCLPSHRGRGVGSAPFLLILLQELFEIKWQLQAKKRPCRGRFYSLLSPPPVWGLEVFIWHQNCKLRRGPVKASGLWLHHLLETTEDPLPAMQQRLCPVEALGLWFSANVWSLEGMKVLIDLLPAMQAKKRSCRGLWPLVSATCLRPWKV